ncbi:LamG-like jellyroll fold domain-containing protein [Roseobacter sp. A03A-229]
MATEDKDAGPRGAPQENATDNRTARPSDEQSRFVDVRFESGDATTLSAAASSNLAALSGLVGTEAEAAPVEGPMSGAPADRADAVAQDDAVLPEPTQRSGEEARLEGAGAEALAQPSGTPQVGASAAPQTLDLDLDVTPVAAPGAGDRPAAERDVAARSEPAQDAEASAAAAAPPEGGSTATPSATREAADDSPEPVVTAAAVPQPAAVAPTLQVLSGGSVVENSATGTVVATLAASDADGAVSYVLTDAAGTPVVDPNFEIVGNEIRIKPGADLDFEAAESHALFVTARDADATSDPLPVTVTVTDTAETLTLADGGVTFVDSGVTETLVAGGAGDDAVTGTAADDVISGAGGHDTLTGAAGDDALSLGAGDDVAMAGSGDDTITGGAGDDTIDGGADDDRAIWDGDLADFTVTYDSGADTFTITDVNAADGDEGSDQVTGVETFTFNGTDYSAAYLQSYAANTAPTDITMTGGTVNETVASGGSIGASYDPSGDVVATLSTSDANAGDSHTYSLVNDPSGVFEVVGNEIRVRSGQTIDHETDPSFDLTVRVTDQFGATYDEVLTINVQNAESSYAAGSGGETVTGTSEEDTLTGGSGIDSLYGGDGDDTLIDGRGGRDTLDGGEGSDRIFLNHSDGATSNIVTDTGTSGTDTLVLDNGAGTYRVQGDFSAATSGIEVIDGSQTSGDDLGTQDGAANFDFSGMTLVGVDRIIGTNNDDQIIGSDGGDQIVGFAGDDSISGMGGNDTLHGGVGRDTVHGGDGDDVITADGSASGAPVLLMNFEDGASGVASDAGPNGVDGVYQGDASTGSVGWNGAGTAATLDGSGDYIEVPHDPAFALSSGTVSVRFNADNLAGQQTIFSRDSSYFDNGGHLTLWVESDGGLKLRIQSETDSYFIDTASGLVSPGSWAHAAVTFGPDGLELYLDGTLVGTNSYTGGISGNMEPWTLGASQWKSGDAVADNLQQYFEGAIDEFAIFEGQLSSSEVSDLATNGVTALIDGNLLNGDGGNDTITGGDGNDQILGGAGDDLLVGQEGNDTIDGGADDDTIQVADTHGTDSISGGDGFDMLEFLGTHGVEVTSTADGAGDYAFRSGGGADGTFSEIERMILSDGADRVDGSADTAGLDIDAGAGDDTLTLGSGDDVVTGGSGSDAFLIGSQEGADTVDGGLAGGWTDVITLEGMGNGYSISGDTVDGDGWTMVLESGHSVVSDSAGVLQLSQDASGVISFDDGGTIDFTGIEQINF